MKKKLLALVTIACVACLSLVLVGCSGGDKKSDSDKFILGYDNTFKPFGYLDDNGNPTGFDIDLATEACERLGWNLELNAIDWDTKDAQIESGSITCIWNGFTMEGREDQYTFTAPYYSNTQVVVVKASLLCLILLVRRFLLRPTLLLITYFLTVAIKKNLPQRLQALKLTVNITPHLCSLKAVL